jgi:hypothetical protein
MRLGSRGADGRQLARFSGEGGSNDRVHTQATPGNEEGVSKLAGTEARESASFETPLNSLPTAPE